MEPVAATSDMFRQALHIAALADYFFVSEQLNVGNETQTIASKPVALEFIKLFHDLGIECDSIVNPDNEMFIHIVFPSPEEKEKVDDFFMNFNFNTRPNFGIPMPNIYEGGDTPVIKVTNQYHTTIHHFFTPGSGRPLRIPLGRDNAPIEAMLKAAFGHTQNLYEEGRNGRTWHAEFTEAGFQGFTWFTNW